MIKDNICTKGLLTTCSSKMLANVVPIYDAHVIKKLRAEETIFLGKTNMDEFAMGSTTESSYFQATHNPWNLDRVPGGSSGGSAAAIAAGEAIWTLGSDTGGSIRQPASFNGCVGIKPTYGRVSRYGCVAFASSLDQIGPITRDVTDAATVLNTICGKDEHDSTSLPVEVPDFTKALRQDVKGLRIGLPKEYYGEGLDPKVHAELKKAIAQYEAMGAEINYLLRMGYTCPIDVRPILIPFSDYEQEPDAATLKKYRDGVTNILFVGRIAPNKKFEDIIRAFYYYKTQKNPNSRLILVGSCGGMENYQQALEQYVRQLGLEQSVIFSGHVSFPQILAFYHAADRSGRFW